MLSKITIFITRLYINHWRGKAYRKLNILWLNPPYNEQKCTNVGRKYLNLMGKHFPPQSKLHRLFNRKNIKVSYSCTAVGKSIINRHNKSIFRSYNEVKNSSSSLTYCNCRNKANCPLEGKCCLSSAVYKDVLSTGDGGKVYYVSCSTTLKARYYNHNHSFRDYRKRNATELWKAVGNARTTTKHHQSHGPS